MGRNSHYFEGKETRARVAREHTKNMAETEYENIYHSAQTTCTYGGDNGADWLRKKVEPRTSGDTIITIDDIDSVGAIFKYRNDTDRMAVLNFASYRNPGGMFMEGSKAQEECLCHASYLYNVISQFSQFYAWNNQHKNKGMYTNRALYTPAVKFFDYGATETKSCFCDVITCACPNWSVALRYGNFTRQENTQACSSRAEFILRVAADRYVGTLILGAYGCGVFAQDATEIASIFKNLLDTKYKNVFRQVIFAIPAGGRDNNLGKFQSVFNG